MLACLQEPSQTSNLTRRVPGCLSYLLGTYRFSATEDEIREKFAECGEVRAVNLVNDRHTGQPRGFGFVEMDEEGAQKAIQSLHNTDFGGRALRVDRANSQ